MRSENSLEGEDMNRIYPGKVTNVEILPHKDGKPEPLPDWQAAMPVIAM